MKPEYILRNWSIIARQRHEYEAPELAFPSIRGNVYGGHPRVEDGQELFSGTILKFDTDAMVVETRRSIYKLDGPPEMKFAEYLAKNNYTIERYKRGKLWI